MDHDQFDLFEVNNIKSNWKKWLHVFDNCIALSFVVALDEFDEYDSETNLNKINQAIEMLKEIISMGCFKYTPVILFLNKRDKFEEKLRRIPFRIPGERFDDFVGPNWDYKNNSKSCNEDEFKKYSSAVSDYIFNCFCKKIKSNGNRDIYNHVTCFNDSTKFQKIFEICKDTNMKSNLYDSGYM